MTDKEQKQNKNVFVSGHSNADTACTQLILTIEATANLKSTPRAKP